VLTIEASSQFRKGRAQNFLDPEHTEQIVSWYRAFEDVEDRAKVVSLGTLKVRVHHQANRCADEVIRHFCDELNQTETIFSGTQLRLVYESVSDLTASDYWTT
jgi:type I restriction-modification system DNA methylase subunit